MKAKPYIGVTGFMSGSAVQRAVIAHETAWIAAGQMPEPGPTHDLMIGVLASSKTIAGVPNKYPLRYPDRAEIATLFPVWDNVLNLIHYATGGAVDTLASDMAIAMAYAGKRCHGIQINAIWPDPQQVAIFRAGFPNHRVVLQLGPGAMGSMGWRAQDIARRVQAEYRDTVTDVLVDVSGGRGTSAGLADATSIVKELQGMDAWVVGIAGGLCADALRADEQLRDLIHMEHPISVDAEGRLRDDHHGGGILMEDAMIAYIREAVSLMVSADAFTHAIEGA